MDMKFWSRQERLWPGFLKKVRGKKITIIGIGATGSYSAYFAAQMGFSTILLVDPDKVEISNLNRTLFKISHIGMYKVDAMAEMIKERVGDINIEVQKKKVEMLNRDLIKADVVLSCLDVMDARLYLTDLTYRMKVPLIDVGTQDEKIRVQFSSYPGPCLACTIPLELYGDIIGLKDSCTQFKEDFAPSGPLIPPMASSLLLNTLKRYFDGEDLNGFVMYFDAKKMEIRKERVVKNPSCFICSKISK